MLYSERKRLADLALRESKGENIWTSEIPMPLRRKLIRLIPLYGEVVSRYGTSSYDDGDDRLLAVARYIIIEETGKSTLAGGKGADDMRSYIMHAPHDEFPDILESLISSLKALLRNSVEGTSNVESFEKSLNELLDSYRVAFSIENGEVIPYHSRELHTSIILPTLRLLTQKGWEPVEKSYQDSLKELAGGKPEDAITDATTALQEALRNVGCKGENFSDLLKSAKSTILKGYDSKYIEGIDQLISWASAMRSNKGDSHKVTAAEKEDAWFVVHLVGILLLRLSKIQ